VGRESRALSQVTWPGWILEKDKLTFALFHGRGNGLLGIVEHWEGAYVLRKFYLRYHCFYFDNARRLIPTVGRRRCDPASKMQCCQWLVLHSCSNIVASLSKGGVA
jgi:hypothetical protein